MKSVLITLLLFGAAQVFAEDTVLTTEADATANVCFNGDRARNFRVLNDRTLIIQEFGRREYRLDLGFCFDLSWAQKIGFRTFGGFSHVCRGDEVWVYRSQFDKRPSDRCAIRRITRIR